MIALYLTDSAKSWCFTVTPELKYDFTVTRRGPGWFGNNEEKCKLGIDECVQGLKKQVEGCLHGGN
jgi:hypothetical protein